MPFLAAPSVVAPCLAAPGPAASSPAAPCPSVAAAASSARRRKQTPSELPDGQALAELLRRSLARAAPGVSEWLSPDRYLMYGLLCPLNASRLRKSGKRRAHSFFGIRSFRRP